MSSVSKTDRRRPKQIAVLGSTGSIGTNALDVIPASEGRLQAIALSAHSKFKQLVAQASEFKPRWVVATNERTAASFDWSELPPETELLIGAEALNKVVADPAVDVVLAAIVGRAGLESTWAALENKKTVALANKETLVDGRAAGDGTGPGAASHIAAGRQRAQCDFPGPAGRSAERSRAAGADC